MAVRLQLENGKTKQYATCWYTGGIESGDKVTYHTKCGINTEEWPKNGACDHIECAIYAAEQNIKHPFGMLALFSCMLLAICWLDGEGFGPSISCIVFCGLIFGLTSIGDFKDKGELLEFRNHGTIHGHKARKI